MLAPRSVRLPDAPRNGFDERQRFHLHRRKGALQRSSYKLRSTPQPEIADFPPWSPDDFWRFVSVFVFFVWQAVSREGIETSDRAWYEDVRLSSSVAVLVPPIWLYGTFWLVFGTLASVSTWLTVRSRPRSVSLFVFATATILNVVFEKNWAIFFWIRSTLFGSLSGISFALVVSIGMAVTAIVAYASLVSSWLNGGIVGPTGRAAMVLHFPFAVWNVYVVYVNAVFVALA